MATVEQASEYFAAGLSCAQSVFSAFAPGLGLDAQTALRIAGAFGGGMGRMGEVCGAVTGAFMALGLKYGSIDSTDKEARDAVYSRVQEFTARFRARNGQVRCSALLGIDMSDPQARDEARARGAFDTQCSKYVCDAAEILRELLQEAKL